MGKRLTKSLNRSNLYLVRLWPGNVVSNPENPSAFTTSPVSVQWSGKVQRVVTGETQTFTTLQELVKLLEAMSSNDNQSANQ